ncbi:MAG: response regulator transcription factor [Anaerolineales bacterium]|jgi:DNA-binding response OmpR family regulator
MINSKTNKTVLIVDDEATIRDVICRYLKRDGYIVREAADGYTALDIIQENPPDLILLDIMLPGIDGLTITRHIRVDRHIPIIMLTAKGDTNDRIRGLDLGADDYIAKPFSPQEVVSRVRAVLRRVSDSSSSGNQKVLEFQGLKIDPVSRTVTINDQEISLTAKEFDLLWHFAKNPRQVFSRSQLLADVWGDEYYTDPSTVTVHIRRLREKIESNPGSPEHLLTVWGVGYKFEG